MFSKMRFAVRFLSTRCAWDAVEVSPHLSMKDKPGVYQGRFLQNVLEVKKVLTVTDWTKLYKVCPIPGFGFRAFNALMRNRRGLSEIRKLISGLESSNSLNPILKAQMFPAFETHVEDCNEKDHQYILDTCDEVTKQFPVLTPEVVYLLLRGLVATPLWKERGERLIANINNEVDVLILSTLASGAFFHRDFKYGWKVLSEAVPLGKNLHPKVYDRILDCHAQQPELKLLFKLQTFLEKHSFMLSLNAAEKMSDALEKSDNWVARFTHIKLSGHCECCKRKLKRVPLTVEEHKELLKMIEDRFDVNNKYTTYEKEEVAAFKTFLKKCPPYSVVVDGPNFFFRKTQENIEPMLNELKERGHTILVICKDHMKKHKGFMSIFKGHLSYFVKDRSQDDVFAIYAALSSSPETLIVSNDYYGTYYSKLGGQARKLFRRWQLTTHVLGLYNLIIPEFSPLCQSSDDGSCIHIPLVTDHSWQAFAPSGWLCIQKVTKEEKKKSSKLWPKKEFILQSENRIDSFRMHGKQLYERKKREKAARKIRYW